MLDPDELEELRLDGAALLPTPVTFTSPVQAESPSGIGYSVYATVATMRVLFSDAATNGPEAHAAQFSDHPKVVGHFAFDAAIEPGWRYVKDGLTYQIDFVSPLGSNDVLRFFLAHQVSE